MSSAALFSCERSEAGNIPSRENFDFGWSFKYFGPGDPEEEGSPVRADGSQSGHPAANAIDGNMETRWCAANANAGHNITLVPGVSEPIGRIVVHWENADPHEIIVDLVTKESRGKKSGMMLRQQKFTKNGKQSVIEVDGKTLDRIKITVNKTNSRSWASVREIELYSPEGKRIIPQASSSVGPAHPEYKAQGFKAVQLPHDWAIESPFLKDEPNETGKLPWNGYGWYRKKFEVPADFNAEKERYYLDFDGVMAKPQIYVNGKKAGEWAYGYASFRVDITRFLKPGKNLVAVMASNKPLSTRWYPGAGIYRHG